ncbi:MULTISPECIES: hypothetical protein [Brachyspira]|uniref:Uncharacterized protein n=1 Tax=Brachyspira murdochii (strain ATCC 51284 / DSM 12563 / 56-150) TaxID=526224 RepID=D5U4V7_BRAM5|nr:MULTISPECIES: hypothetical protein [Brachyspira]ADG71418.1 hypothetical protein Bmur_1328 [Brachyspira murdochii DSM 12563]ADG72361.1 hypothetical protein Bmur_2288 [Brachyspira murdochii DSM 12563]
MIIKKHFIKLIDLEEPYSWEFKQSEEDREKIDLIIEELNNKNKIYEYDKWKDIMKDTIIIFDNTKENQTLIKTKGSYEDILIGYATLIYQTAINTKKKPEDVVLDILYKVKDNKETLYKYIKKNKGNKK